MKRIHTDPGAAPSATPPRQSSFELLRLLAMLGIVAGHIFTEGNLISRATPDTLLPCLLLGSGARVATNVFVLLGCWFLVDATRPGSASFAPGRRWLRLHFTVLCWTAPLTLLALALGAHPPDAVLFRSFIPYLGRPLWFASAWMTLLLLVPFLRHALELPVRRFTGLVVIGLVVVVLQSTIADIREGYLTDTFWFLYAYLFIGWLRLHGECILRRIPATGALAAGLAIYAALVLSEGWARTHWGTPAASTVHALASRFLDDLKSAPNFLCALSFLVFFAKLRLPHIPFVNASARPAFAVYVAHQAPVFWPILWTRIVCCQTWRGRPWTPLAALGIVLAIYAVVAILETVRLRFLEPLWTRSRTFLRLTFLLDRLVGAA